MINRVKSHTLLAYEALYRRLLPQHRSNQVIQSGYFTHQAGFFGEKSIDYKLSLFPKKNFLHLPGLRLKNGTNFFQIDSTLLTPHAIFIIEAKNLRGVLEYQTGTRQLIQVDGDQQNGFKDPVLQAMIQKKHLQVWLREIGLDIPIEPVVVSTNPRSIIKNLNEDK